MTDAAPSQPQHTPHKPARPTWWRRTAARQLDRVERWGEETQRTAEQTAAALASLGRLGEDMWALGLRAAEHWRQTGVQTLRRALRLPDGDERGSV